jgi:hypothetical protein
MWRYAETVPAYMWQINTMAGSRKITWMEFDDSDVIGVYEAMSGALIKSDKTVERISKLEDRGFLDSDGKPNVVVVKIAPFELDESMLQTETPAALNLPAPSAELTELGFELAKEDAAMLEQYYPEHIRPYFRQSAYTSFGRTGLNARVLQMLAEDGTLTVPREDRRRGMQTLMFADRLPE